MEILLIGMILIVVGVFSIQFKDLCSALESSDKSQWKLLGSPKGLSFADLGKTLGLYSWILDYGFDQSSDTKIVQQGRAAYRKALFAKYTLLWGCTFLVLGYGLSLFGA